MKIHSSKIAIVASVGMITFLGVGTAGPLRSLTQRDSAQTPPAGGSGDSLAPILTPDGRFVLFASTANNLVANASGNSLPVLPGSPLNVFRRNRAKGTTVLVSANLDASGGANSNSIPTAISSDGRYALFESSATNLSPLATNGFTEVFLRDLQNNLTFLVSVSTNGGPANGTCRSSVVTPDGRFVAFVSEANNLVSGDTNGIPDVFVRDLQNQATTWVSAGATATNSPFRGSEAPLITPDGRYVAFFSVATNLLGFYNGGDIYLCDLTGPTRITVSTDAHSLLGAQYAVSCNHALSDDGRFVAYEACANPQSRFGYTQAFILRFDTTTASTTIIHTNAYAPAIAPEEASSLDMTPDGRFIAFVARTDTNGTTCVLLWDAQSGTNMLVSGDVNGNVQTNSTCDSPTIDSTGRFLSFLSSATNVVLNSLVGDHHLYVHDTQAGTTTLVDGDTNGVGTSLNPATIPRLSLDGSLIALDSIDAGLVPNDRNHNNDVFVRDLSANTTELISAHDPALPSVTPNGPVSISPGCSSADGRWVVFSSGADNLVPNDTNGFRDIFVRDVRYGTNSLVSLGTNGVAADGDCFEPIISADGRYVVFTSWADNLVAGDTNRSSDVFIRDLQAGTTSLVSMNTNGTGPGNNSSYSPVLSSDGRFVLFRSLANNLTATRVFGFENLFLRDLQNQTNYALTTLGVLSGAMTPDGRFVAFADNSYVTTNIYVWDSQAAALVETNHALTTAVNLSISQDGSKIAYFSGRDIPGPLALIDRVAGTNGPIDSGYGGWRVGPRFSADGRFLTYAVAPFSTGTKQVHLYDCQTGTNLLVSSASGSSVGASGFSDSPDISPDGRFVAYRSSATNLLSTPLSNNGPNIFLYDRLDGTSTLLSANRLNAGTADNRSLIPVFIAVGRSLVFQSWGSDLVPFDFNHWDDLFSLSFLYVSISPSTVPGQGPTLTWPARPGENYQVQFKDSLDQVAWRDVIGTVTISGDQASLTDLGSSSGKRFYRVTAF